MNKPNIQSEVTISQKYVTKMKWFIDDLVETNAFDTVIESSNVLVNDIIDILKNHIDNINKQKWITDEEMSKNSHLFIVLTMNKELNKEEEKLQIDNSNLSESISKKIISLIGNSNFLKYV